MADLVAGSKKLVTSKRVNNIKFQRQTHKLSLQTIAVTSSII